MTIKSYMTGFGLSLLLTLAAFSLIATRSLSTELTFAALVALALAQLVVQLVYFLHLGREKTSWNLTALIFSVFVVVVLVGGSIWIMSHLEYRAHSAKDIIESEALTPLMHGD